MKEAINSLFLCAAYALALNCSHPCRLNSKLNRLYFDEWRKSQSPSTSGGTEVKVGLSQRMWGSCLQKT